MVFKQIKEVKWIPDLIGDDEIDKERDFQVPLFIFGGKGILVCTRSPKRHLMTIRIQWGKEEY